MPLGRGGQLSVSARKFACELPRNDDIALRLNISTGTAQYHFDCIRTKLGATRARGGYKGIAQRACLSRACFGATKSARHASAAPTLTQKMDINEAIVCKGFKKRVEQVGFIWKVDEKILSRTNVYYNSHRSGPWARNDSDL